ncbi:RHTO0S02e13916g1_1 [Rhodotorula toruloides]|uniref:RHTO0S02e13916g1_1 n=2 Tax=Rhodotorula toruloides TaxID=5286 RepID=A0A061AIH3_RHOTO|nr:RHTO0S02e13916g1_1 [Rhodotorula toruloides]
MTRSSHHHKEVPHNLRSNYMPLKKEGSGRANWGSDHDDIVEGIALARSDDWISHSPADVGAHKISISPPTSPSLADTAAKSADPAPSASA